MSGDSLSSAAHAGLTYVETEDRRTIAALGFRLSFFRIGERWSHALAIGPEGGPAELEGLAEVVEGEPDRDDRMRVVSPTYQEVHEHAVPDGICLLLTGQSTPHHFSAVVTARRDADGVTVEFDVADRCREPVVTLGAMYLVRLGSSDLSDAGTGRIVWEGDALGTGRLEFAADDPSSASLSEAGRRASRVQALARIVPTERTQRLCYRWRWSPAAPAVTAR
ncbi:hypothetical protein SAMN05444166_7972 [Singulisphaera sp. GP187]|uniref:hypothetical protein n=1 Tax=Singulisphaera sp. GP187 TaxID=1882752 RepID=UPI000926B469|nr:hypothetical protein [Singulisphaera sp. GP187]SIO66136.1 hypothetical protein SAMN05444166_7972 [Singulisphaera sp. GP187]